MSNREISKETIVVHERALKALGLKMALVALEVARDLRNGAIPPEKYYQGSYCGSACCIFGHIESRIGKSGYNRVGRAIDLMLDDYALSNLFAGRHPSIPELAADAIENYVINGANIPWIERSGH